MEADVRLTAEDMVPAKARRPVIAIHTAAQQQQVWREDQRQGPDNKPAARAHL